MRGIKRGTSADEVMNPTGGGGGAKPFNPTQTMSRPAAGGVIGGAPPATGGDKKKPSRGFEF
jgi:hypothetical protein